MFSNNLNDLLAKITTLEEVFFPFNIQFQNQDNRTKQYNYEVEVERHKKTTSELEAGMFFYFVFYSIVKKECLELMEERMKFCEKLASLVENNSSKEKEIEYINL